MADKTPHDELIEFRITKLEETMGILSENLSVLKEVVLKWDNRISAADGFLSCPMHKEKMQQFEQRLLKVETIIEELNAFKWKAVGILSALMLVIQLFGPTAIEYFKGHTHTINPPVAVQDAANGYRLDLTNKMRFPQ